MGKCTKRWEIHFYKCHHTLHFRIFCGELVQAIVFFKEYTTSFSLKYVLLIQYNAVYNYTKAI